MTLGAALGAAASTVFDARSPMWVTGGLGTLALLSTGVWLIDGHRIRSLQRWLSGTMQLEPPKIAGPLGEVAYRIEKAVKARERAAEAERQSLEQFLAAIEVSPNGVLLLDDADQVQWFNRTAASHFGLDPSRDHRQRVTNLVRAPAFVAHLHAHDEKGDVVFLSPRGDATLSVLVRPYGKSMRLVLSQDITERERTDAMRRDFVANVSHEIRSPLTVLAGFVETLAELPLTVAEKERVLLLMRQQAHRMQALVSDLLALAQIEGAPRPPSDQWVDVAGLMQHLESDAMALDGSRHRLTFANDGVASIAGSDTELLSACWNLVSNALRYSPDGGHVHVAWSIRADGMSEFCVSDDGPGIAREHIPRLTERFYRVDGSRSRETGGTGLGLAIVKHVVQRHEGELLISSEPGQGSQFRVQLPKYRSRVVDEALAEDIAAAGG